MSKFKRSSIPKKSYHKLYCIVTEGEKSEKNYFENIKDLIKKHSNKNNEFIVKIETIPTKNGDSAPNHLIIRAEEKEKNLIDNDEIWIVHDKDSWSIEQLNALNKWQKVNNYRHLAISVPKFEYWVLLHFEDGTGLKGKSVDNVLKKYLPNYNKDYNFDFTFDDVEMACQRAKFRHSQESNEYSTLYLLLHTLFDFKKLSVS